MKHIEEVKIAEQRYWAILKTRNDYDIEQTHEVLYEMPQAERARFTGWEKQTIQFLSKIERLQTLKFTSMKDEKGHILH